MLSLCRWCFKWTIIATICQLAMVILVHYVPFIKDNVFAIGGIVAYVVAGPKPCYASAG